MSLCSQESCGSEARATAALLQTTAAASSQQQYALPVSAAEAGRRLIGAQDD